MQLLRCLISPHDNHALAWALRSPVFDCSDADLMAPADAGAASWFKRLPMLSPPVKRAHATRAASLCNLSASADKVPGDLPIGCITRQYSGALRGHAATPARRAEANLAHFRLALDIDSGRYRAWRFPARLALRAIDEAAPETAAAGVGRCIPPSTPKAPEAPVVF